MQRTELEAVARELRTELEGARINKVHQPEETLLILRFWTGRKNLDLLIQAGSEPRIHLTSQKFPNPQRPPRFCQLLRARLGRLSAVRLVPGDRLLRLEFQDASQAPAVLLVSLRGTLANVLYLNAEGKIIDALRRDGNRALGFGLLGSRIDEMQKQLEQIDVNIPSPKGKSDPSLEGVPGPSAAIEAGTGGDRGQSGGQGRELERAANRHRKKLLRRLQSIEADRLRCEGGERRRELGDLLLAQMYKVKKGMESVVLDDYYSESAEPVEVELRPDQSPAQNAERYFKLSGKAQRGLAHVERRSTEAREELDWLDAVLHSLQEAEGPMELLPIREELIEAGVYKEPRAMAQRPRQETPAGLRETRAPSGARILFGRNNRANDYLSRVLAKSGDHWFHAKGVPGCHLVLKSADPTQEDLLFAASLAAGYSRARNEGRAEVMVADPAHIRKPKGSRPGAVTVSVFRSLLVAPRRLEDEH